MSYTPGPWKIEQREGHAFEPRYVVCTLKGGDERVAVISLRGAPQGDHSIEMANAVLIANAPELLALCREKAENCPYCAGTEAVASVYYWVLDGETPWGDPCGHAEEEAVQCGYCAPLWEIIRRIELESTLGLMREDAF